MQLVGEYRKKIKKWKHFKSQNTRVRKELKTQIQPFKNKESWIHDSG